MLTQKNQDKSYTSEAVGNRVAQKKSKNAIHQLMDNRKEAVIQQQLIDKPIQKKPNNTGLPDTLKSGIENLSGYAMDDVKVHYNSNKPAQLNAHAYAQGTDIHVASGQEKHVPHEAWHVVQQKQGRVQPTTSVNGAQVNDNVGLETEADVMGAKAAQLQIKSQSLNKKEDNNDTKQLKIISNLKQSRSTIHQLKYEWSDIGEDGVLMGADEKHVIKLGGYDSLAVPLDKLGAQFGFTIANAEIVTNKDPKWELVTKAVKEVGGWNKEGSDTPKTEALVMDKLEGKPLHKTINSITTVNPDNPTKSELEKIKKMCFDLGKMLVMDLLTRNNDRFNLVNFDDELLATDEEKVVTDNWRRWEANEGNMLVNEETGNVNPIDSQFTPATDESQYADNVAELLTEKIDELVASGIIILEGHNWGKKGYAKTAFKEGIEQGIKYLMTM